MHRAVPVLLVALLGGLWAVPAAEPQAAAIAGDDYQVLFPDESSPYLVRFHVQTTGKPYRLSWDDSVAELFRFLDVGGHGVLSEKELARAPSANQFLRMLQGAEDLEPEPAPRYAEVAGEGPGARVTLARLAAYYSRSPARPLVPEWVVKNGKTDGLSDALFRHLDGDKDRRLSAAELDAAPTVLGKLDTDLDELISPAELSPMSFERFAHVSLERPPPGRLPPLLVIDSDASLDAAVGRLIERYDSDKDGRLSRKEIGFEEASFARLDADKNGTLDRPELTSWLKGSPDQEIVIRLSGKGGPAVAALPASGTRHANLTATPTRHGSLLLTTPGAQMDILVKGGGDAPAAKRERARLELLFRGLDTDKNDVLESREAFRPPFTMVPYLRLADRDGDGKLTWREWSAFLDLREKIAAQAVLMTWLDRGRRLFDFLDANHDGLLSRRELATARVRLAPFARQGGLAADDVPRQSQLLFQFDRPGGTSPSTVANGPNSFTPAPRYSGPLWFRKMDRNRDGDVSPGEFLGTPELFRKIDADGDGLIDPDEAERADAEYRRSRPSPR